MFDERDRIAADLHDHVIQRLFATGLSLQSIVGVLPSGKGKDRVQTAIGDLDDTIKQIRTTIFELQQAPNVQPVSVRGRLLDVVAAAAPVLGFDPAVRFSGALEGQFPEPAIEDLLAVVREALSNIARHAQARTAIVSVSAPGDWLTLQVTDDGVGVDLDAVSRRSGLANLQRRAERHGGSFTLAAREPTGTQLTWTVPSSRPGGA
jgi:signal transduction histidine kinase